MRIAPAVLSLLIAAGISASAADTPYGIRLGAGVTPGLTDLGSQGKPDSVDVGTYLEPQFTYSSQLQSGLGFVGVVGLRIGNGGAKLNDSGYEIKVTTSSTVLTLSPRLSYAVNGALSLEAGPVVGLGRTTAAEEVSALGITENDSGSTSLVGFIAGSSYAVSKAITVGAEVGYISSRIRAEGGDWKSTGVTAGVTAGYRF